MNLAYPYRFDHRGRTAEATDERHIRDLIEQVLFTAPGERVNAARLRQRRAATRVRAELRRARRLRRRCWCRARCSAGSAI